MESVTKVITAWSRKGMKMSDDDLAKLYNRLATGELETSPGVDGEYPSVQSLVSPKQDGSARAKDAVEKLTLPSCCMVCQFT